MTRIAARRLQKGNPHQLTIKQHVLPRQSIARFTGQDAKVEVQRLGQTATIRLKPNNPIFCADRAWDQRAEAGYSRSIEIEFQHLVDLLLAGKYFLKEIDHLTVTRFWALWRLRAEARKNLPSPVKLKGVIETRELSIFEQEALEAKHISYVENGNEIPSHIISGLQMQAQIDRLTMTPICWGVIKSAIIEFIVPDTIGTSGFVPLSSNTALLANLANGPIDSQAAIRINQVLRDGATHYIFAKHIARTLSERET